MTTETSNAREWVLVPRVPTEAMIGAFKQAHDEHAALRIPKVYAKGQREAANVVVGYRAMLAAAPPPAAARGDVLLQTALRNLPQYISKSGLVGPDKHSAMQCFEVIREALAAEGVQAGEVEAEEAAHMRTIEQRDAAEDALSRMYRAVTGSDPEWSSAWGFVDAVEEVEEHVAALSQQPEARGVLSEPDRIGLYQGPDDCPQLMVNGRAVAIFPAGSWAKVCDAMDSITGSEPKPEARGVVDEDALEALIGDAEGARWSDDEFRIDGRGLMKLLRDAAALTGERNG